MSDDVSRDDLAWKEACRREWSICELLRRYLARLTGRNYWRGHLPNRYDWAARTGIISTIRERPLAMCRTLKIR